MTCRRLFAALALASLAAARPAPAAAQGRERSLYVSVVNEAGAPVPDLGPTDFIVREDNVRREVLRVALADEPMQIALLVDTSVTARNDIAQMRLALPAFVNALTAPNSRGLRNQLAIVAFGERPTIVTDYTSDPAELKKGIDRIWSLRESGAYLLDAIVEVCQGFAKREATRPVIVAVAAEGPELSYRFHEQTLGALADSHAAFYALMMGQPYSDNSDESRSRNIVLDRGTAASGGYHQQLLTSMGLGTRLKQLAGLLTHEYLVTYSRPESLIPPEKVTVAAANPALTARGTERKSQGLQ